MLFFITFYITTYIIYSIFMVFICFTKLKRKSIKVPSLAEHILHLHMHLFALEGYSMQLLSRLQKVCCVTSLINYSITQSVNNG